MPRKQPTTLAECNAELELAQKQLRQYQNREKGRPHLLRPCGLCPRGRTVETGNGMTIAMPFLQKAILLSYDPRLYAAGAFFLGWRMRNSQ